jgi:oxygen-independent coproporphyrinogen-3 oxidase
MREGRVPILMGQVHTWDDAVARYPALGVRCLDFETTTFHARFGTSFNELYRLELAFLREKGWLSISPDRVEVTRAGKYFIDNISKTFFNPRNRGKTQLWGVQLTDLTPRYTSAQGDLLSLADQQATRA